MKKKTIKTIYVYSFAYLMSFLLMFIILISTELYYFNTINYLPAIVVSGFFSIPVPLPACLYAYYS